MQRFQRTGERRLEVIILTLNCGSSSVKYQLYDWENKSVLAKGAVERVTVGDSFIVHSAKGMDDKKIEHDCQNHREAIELIIKTIINPEYGAIGKIEDVEAVGHRVVHGGDKFSKSTIIDDRVMATFRDVQHMAPLHVPANIMGIEAATEVLPSVPHCAIMDTAWHQTMPKTAYMYAVPYEWYERYSVRRYGFHGTSFLYCAKRASVLLKKNPFDVNAIICHIGNGASVCAVKNGKSVDTSMGLTPLEGLIMGTRSGDCDPALGFYITRQTGMKPDDIENTMNRKSGLIGITGNMVDRRDIKTAADSGDERAQLAVEMESYRIKKYIGAYCAALGKVDALVFTAGVGEMQPSIREKAVEGLSRFGISMDLQKNSLSLTRNAETEVSSPDSATRIFIIPTDEELVMTEDTHALITGTYDIHTKFEYSFQKSGYINRERSEALRKELKKNPDIESIVHSAG